MIDISGFSVAQVLMALFNAAEARGFGCLEPQHPMDLDEAEGVLRDIENDFFDPELDRDVRMFYVFDYVRGRPLKADLRGDVFDPTLFDRSHGTGSAAAAIMGVR